GDMYGGYWAHWILWSSILGTSISNKEKNNFSEKLEFSTLAMITNGVITELMKRSFGRVRPNGGCCKSFPSGHTSHSFTVATIANELYGKEVGIAAYCLAALVATSRIHDNKHYLSDVIFGAGLGTAVGRGFALTYRDRINNKIVSIDSPLTIRITIPLN
ncbi:MAG: phosphatase PAP2 family protein, partial [Candidatus Neomarinimicrobiota bacterium]|nr:phosphatase PAP2 family protein [Candidatus Neomarinimicrobiota bacterium]